MGQVLLKRSKIPNRIPSASGMSYGEVMVNYASGTGTAFLATKKYDGKVAQFMEKGYNDAAYASATKVETLSSTVTNINNNYISGAVLSETATAPSVKNNILTIPIKQGVQGSQGNQGTQGLQGETGKEGNQGIQGGVGKEGTQGWQGSTGPNGDKGNKGKDGSQGNQGGTGLSGTQGNQGNQGAQGNQGTQGNQGKQGSVGGTGPSITILSSTGTTAYLTGVESSSEVYATSTSWYHSKYVYMYGGYLYTTSDERLKNFGSNVECDLDKLSNVPKKYFTWKNDKEKKVQIGTSAQELQKLYPEIVTTDTNGNLGVAYERLSIIALAAVDKLHSENKELRPEIELLKKEIEDLKK